MELLERQRELHALRTTAAHLVAQINGKYVAWIVEDLSRLEKISARLSDEFRDLGGKVLADEVLAQLVIRRFKSTKENLA